MRAINLYLVISKIKTEQKKVAGLIITEKADVDNRYIRGEIISTGNLVEGVCDGDIIHYDKHAGHGLTWEGKEYQVILARDIVLVE
jgi:co-chaperonin GroES (HSP10)